MTMIAERAPRVDGAPSRRRDEEDAGLVARVRAGDLTAYDELVSRHRSWLLRRCAALLGNDAHLAEDIVQDIMLRLLGAIRRDDRPLRVGGWLAVVARHACIDEHRKRQADLPGVLPERTVHPEEPLALDAPLAAAWAALPGRHREVLYLREIVGFPYAEIAGTLDLSVSAVETLLFRARNALRREYVRAGGGTVSFGALGAGLRRLDFTGLAGLPAAPGTQKAAALAASVDEVPRPLGRVSDGAGMTASESQRTVIDLADRVRRAPARAFEPMASLTDAFRAVGMLGTGLLSSATAVVLSVVPVVPVVPSLMTPAVPSVQPAVTAARTATSDVVGPAATPILKASGDGARAGVGTDGVLPLTSTLSDPLARFRHTMAGVLSDWRRLAGEIGDRFEEQASSAWSDAQGMRDRFEDRASSRWPEGTERLEQRASSVGEDRQHRGVEPRSREASSGTTPAFPQQPTALTTPVTNLSEAVQAADPSIISPLVGSGAGSGLNRTVEEPALAEILHGLEATESNDSSTISPIFGALPTVLDRRS